MAPRRSWPYLVLFGTALILRLIYLLEWRDTALFSVLLGDGRAYDLWARQIAEGRWTGAGPFYQAPLYPYFMALIYRVFGHDLFVLRTVQILLGSASCTLLALAGRRFFDVRVGLVAGFLLACYPPAIFFDGLVQKGVLGGFFTALLLFFVGEFATRRSWPWLLVAGLTLGALALTRENALILPPVLGAWLWLNFRKQSASRRLIWVATLAAGIALVLVPVGLRNQALGGRFMLTTSQLGTNFYYGNNPETDGRYRPLREGRGSVIYERQDATELAQEALGRELEPAEVSHYWLGQALDYIRSDPGDWIGLMARKTLLIWNADEIIDTDSIEAHEDHSLLLRTLGWVLHFGVLCPLGLFGIWITRGRWRGLWLLHAMLIALTAAVALFFVFARYRFPLALLLAPFAAAGLLELIRQLRTSDWPALTRAVLLLALVAVPCNWPVASNVDPRTITYYSLGDELIEDGRAEEARLPLERAVALDPHFVDARFKLGDALFRQGDSAGALAEFREALRLDPEHADSHTGVGMVHAQMGDLEQAESRYEAAIRLDPRHAAALNNLAALRVRQGNLVDAVPLLKRAIIAKPDDPVMHENLARLLSALGHSDESRIEFQRALELARE